MTIVKTADFTLEIMAIPDFSLILPLVSGKAYAGQVFPIGANAESVDQFAGDVEFSIEQLPAGVTAEFLPANKVTIAPGAPKGVQINLTIPADNALKGIHLLKIKAISTTYNGQ
jgi:hypothetical protein